MYSFPSFEPVHCSMSRSVASCIAYGFLRNQVMWSDIPISLRIFQFVVIHTIKGFSIVNETQVDGFSGIPLFFSMIQHMLAIWFLVPLPFLNPAWTSESFQFTYYWSLAWRIWSIILIACEMSAIVWQFEHSMALPFFGIGMKTALCQSCGH